MLTVTEQPLEPLVLTPPLNPIRICTVQELQRVQDFFAKVRSTKDHALGFDLETPPIKDFYRRQVRTIQFGDHQEQYVIDLLSFAGEKLDTCQRNYGANMFHGEGIRPVLDLITPILESNEYLKVGVNLAFEFECMYWNFGIRPWHLYSCDMAERVLVAGAHSLKDYGYFSMASMMARYFNFAIEKELQTSFTLTDPISDEQIYYAALDTRLPLALRIAQSLPTRSFVRMDRTAKGGGLLQHKLDRVTTIENDAIGMFVSMHVHGQNINAEKWNKRIDGYVEELNTKVLSSLDAQFIPKVGTKAPVDDAEIQAADVAWRPLQYKLAQIQPKGFGKMKPEEQQKYTEAYVLIQEKERLKKICGDLKKRRTKIKHLIDDCEGEALINYGSKAQIIKALHEHFKMKALETMEDEELEKYDDEKHPWVAPLRRYSFLSKQIGTYGYSWTTQWNRAQHKGSNKDAWLHPDDGKLHAVFNQLDAGTGRSTSEKPNGQNLPQDPEVRACFEADQPDEEIHISCCCDADTIQTPLVYSCLKCSNPCDTKPEEYVIVTADMSGAELRIIAELANAKTWIDAFNRGEDVHSVGTEILYPDKWPSLTVRSVKSPAFWTVDEAKEEWVLLFNEDGSPLMKKGKQVQVHPCAYYALKSNGEPARQKCDCPGHKKLRDGNKSANFLIAYGGTSYTLKDRIHCGQKEADALMALHKSKFPDIWAYLEQSGLDAQKNGASWDMYGRRRLFLPVTREDAIERVKELREKNIRLKDGWQKNITDFAAANGRLPKGCLSSLDDEGNLVYDFKEEHIKDTEGELWPLMHVDDNTLNYGKEFQKWISQAFISLNERIKRQGKNHAIQGTNASIAKLAMGSGFDKNGKPFLFHILPKYKAKLIAFVHDELVTQCPKRFAEQVAFEIGDAFKRAAAEVMTKVIMEFDYHIASYWMK